MAIALQLPIALAQEEMGRVALDYSNFQSWDGPFSAGPNRVVSVFPLPRNRMAREFVTQSSGYVVDILFDHYLTRFDNLGEFDVIGDEIRLRSEYRLYPSFILGLSYLPQFYRTAEKEEYLRSQRLTPEIMWNINDHFMARFSYSFGNKDFFQDDAWDGYINDIYVGLCYNIFDNKAVLMGGIGYEDYSARETEYNYGNMKTRLGFSVLLPWDVNLALMGQYQDRHFDAVDSRHGVRRDDGKYSGSISISSHLIAEWLSFLAEFQYIRNDSNIDDKNYVNKLTTLSLTIRY